MKQINLFKLLARIFAVSFFLALVITCGSATDPKPQAPNTITYPATNDDTWEAGVEWTQTWSDEFSYAEFDTNTWTRQTLLSPYNNEWQQYPGGTSSDNAYVKDGYMIIKASMKGSKHGKGQYTSARVISNPGGENGTSTAEGRTFLYGKIAARIQLPSGKGVWPAFWMLGANTSETGGSTPWPQCGEIDIMESGSKNDKNYGQGSTHGTLHHDPTVANTPGGANQYLPSAHYTLPNGEFFAEKFHVFELEWNEDEIIWRVDGIEIGDESISQAGRSEFHLPFYAIFNIAIGGDYTVNPDSSTPFPQFMYIDWIRHYTK